VCVSEFIRTICLCLCLYILFIELYTERLVKIKIRLVSPFDTIIYNFSPQKHQSTYLKNCFQEVNTTPGIENTIQLYWNSRSSIGAVGVV
jgi:hypothetical protein